MTLDQAEKEYDIQDDSNDNRMLPGMGQTSDINRMKIKKKSNV